MAVHSSSGTDAKRDIAGVHQLGVRVQLLTGQQQVCETLRPDSLLTCQGLDPEPPIAVVTDRASPEPAVILPRALDHLEPKASLVAHHGHA